VPDGPVTAYTWRIYYLPPPQAKPNAWTTELLSYAKQANINSTQYDPNSGAWRIVYVVTDILYADGRFYHYSGS
jgi:hypothetical protein